jgi:hypothetical protein
MILGAEIGLIIMGIIALTKGKLQLTKTKCIYGTPARLLALIALLPIPLSIVIISTIAVLYAAQGRDVTGAGLRWTATGIEAGILVLCVSLIYGIGWRLASPPE